MWLLKTVVGFPSKVKLWLFGAGGVMALLATLKAYIYFEKRKAGKEAVEDFTNEQVKKSVEVRKDAKKASAREQRETDGLSDSDVADRLRRRTRDFERL